MPWVEIGTSRCWSGLSLALLLSPRARQVAADLPLQRRYVPHCRCASLAVRRHARLPHMPECGLATAVATCPEYLL